MPLNMADLTPRQRRAIRNFCDKGFVVQISRLPNVEFRNRETQEIEILTLEQLLAEYDQDRRENNRSRLAERRIKQAQEAKF